ncbi:MAG: hypothetical protein HY821_08910 [Acidobacteria bacterium]|nr:hypothetical protein [Acidobacteriota bacterium]
MKRLAAFFAVVAICAPALGQISHHLKANIPFDFETGDRVLPAGDYAFEHQTYSGTPVVQVRSQEGSGVAMALAHPATARPGEMEIKLTFNRYGDRYFLAGVVAPERSVQMVKTRSEKTLVTSRMVNVASHPPQLVEIRASLF